MCNLSQSVREQGRIEGEEKGEDRAMMLIQKLLAAGRKEDIEKVSVNSDYRKKLMKELSIN